MLDFCVGGEMRNMVDVCGGKMTLEDVEREVRYYMLQKSPRRMVVDIRRKKDGYHAMIWIPKKCFEAKC